MSELDQERQYIDEVDRASEAKRIMEHPLMVAAFEDEEAELLKLFREGVTEPDALMNASIAIKLLVKIRTRLLHHIETGKMAQRSLWDLDQKRSRQERRHV